MHLSECYCSSCLYLCFWLRVNEQPHMFKRNMVKLWLTIPWGKINDWWKVTIIRGEACATLMQCLSWPPQGSVSKRVMAWNSGMNNYQHHGKKGDCMSGNIKKGNISISDHGLIYSISFTILLLFANEKFWTLSSIFYLFSLSSRASPSSPSFSSVQCCFMSTEAIRTIRDGLLSLLAYYLASKEQLKKLKHRGGRCAPHIWLKALTISWLQIFVLTSVSHRPDW